jgi:hypothetical protein
MTNESLLNEDWTGVVARLGGAEALDATARETKAFVRPREIGNAVDLLRLILPTVLAREACERQPHGRRRSASPISPMWLCCTACANVGSGSQF